MNRIAQQVWDLAQPVAAAQGIELWDVTYTKEAGEWFLRVYIDKPEGVGINDCEAFSRAFDPILDERDPIEGSYTFEVSSAGAERELKRPGDFEKFMGSTTNGTAHEDMLTRGKSEEVVFLDVLEIAVGTHLQFVGGGFVADDDAMLVHLQCADSPHVIDAAFDGGLQGTGLVVAIDKNHHLAGGHHGTDAHGKRGRGHRVQVAVKEAAVSDNGVLGERLLARAGGKR